MAYFGLKLGQDLGNRAAQPYQEFRGVPPPPPPPVQNQGQIEHILSLSHPGKKTQLVM